MYTIVPLTTPDIDSALRLVEQAGWNQTPVDWQRIIEYQPWGCFQATDSGRLVGTVTSISYGRELAWIGMMLVDAELRRQGIGRALMQRVIEVLEQSDVATIKLDATPLGRPLYEQLGFVAQFDFHRWRRAEASTCASATCASVACEPELQPQHYAMDLDAFGVDRSQWLDRIAASSFCQVRADGFGMLRPGRVADYLGPVTAGSSSTAEDIIVRLVGSTTRDIFWDIPRDDIRLHQLASRLGFEPVRVLTRMVLRSDSTHPVLDHQYAICDPGTG